MNKINTLDALKFGIKDAGAKVFTNFPGYKSHDLFAKLDGINTSTNEKVAYEVAWGASLSGKRSVVMFKNVGLNDAADPFLNSMIVGVNAGLVVLVFDDMFVEGSQSRQDSRNYFDFFKGLWFEPYSIQNAYDLMYKSFSLSEKFKLPVVIRLTSQLLYETEEIKRSKRQNVKFKFIKDQRRFAIHPVHSEFQRKQLEIKNEKIKNYINSLYKIEVNRLKKKLFIFGCNIEELKKYDDSFQKIHFFTYPLPESIIKFLDKKYDIQILEQGVEFASEKVKSLSNSNISVNTGIVPDKSAGYIITSNYEKIFMSLTKEKSIIIGDLGEYTKDNLNSVDAVLSFGSAIAVSMGCMLGGLKKVISITGDGSYLHSGKNSIQEALDRKLAFKCIVICNGGSQGTGGQKIPGDLYYQPKGVKVLKVVYKNTSQSKFDKIITQFVNSRHPAVLYVEMK